MTDPAGQGPPPGYPPPGAQGPPPGYPPPGYQPPPAARPFGGLPVPPLGINAPFSLNARAATGVSKAGLISLICGCLSFILLIPAIPAVIYGVKGIREGRVTGKGVGLSIGGLICGVVTLVIAIVVIAIVAAS